MKAPGPALSRAGAMPYPTSLTGLTFLLAFSFLTGAFLSAEVSVTADLTPRKIAMGETADLRINLSGARKASYPSTPTIPGIRFGSWSHTQQTTIINGRYSQSLVLRCQVIPTRQGKFRLVGLTIQADGVVHAIPELGLEVKQGYQSQDLLLALSFSKHEAYISEPVLMTFDWLFNKNIRGYDLSLPWFPPKGFVVNNPDKKLEQQRLRSTGGQAITFNSKSGQQQVFASKSEVEIDGQKYVRLRFQRLLIPISPGEHVFDKTSILCKIVTGRARRRGIFDDFNDPFSNFGFGLGRVKTKTVTASADPVKLEVRPLPDENKPADFAGAVGQFQLEVTASPKEVKVGEPVTLTMKVTGTGNFDSVPEPALTNLKGFRQYDAEFNSEVHIEGSTFRGEKTFTKPIIPNEASLKQIPPVEFTFFDPSQSTYRTLTKGPFPIVVIPEARDSSVGLVSGPEPGQRKLISRPAAGIFPLRKPSLAHFRNRSRPSYRNRTFLAVLPVPLLLCLFCYVFQRHRERIGSDFSLQRRQQATRAARALLRRAKNARTAEFYQLISEAVAGFVADKLDLPPASVDVRTAAELLPEHQVPQERVQALTRLLETCDSGRFGGSASDHDRDTLLADAEQLIRDLAGDLK